MSMNELRNDFEKAEYFQNLLTAFSTGGGGDDKEYKELRRLFLNNAATEKLIPGWIRTCRDLGQFWQFIKYRFAHYAERRDFIWSEFAPLLGFLEKGEAPISAKIINRFAASAFGLLPTVMRQSGSIVALRRAIGEWA